MAYHTFTPPFYSTVTTISSPSSPDPYTLYVSSSNSYAYGTSTTSGYSSNHINYQWQPNISYQNPVPSPNLCFSHGFTPPSPNAYTSPASYSTIPLPSPNPYGYGYSSYYNHKQQPPLPYSQPQPPLPYSPSPPYCHHPPCQPIDVIQRSFDEILQISQRSAYEFTQICQKSKNDLRASHESIKASLNSIKESSEAFCTQEHFQEDEEDPQEPSEVLQEELVDEETEEQPEETEIFLSHDPPPETEVPLAKLNTESVTFEEREGSIKTAGVQKSANPTLRPPPPKPPDSGAFMGENGSPTAAKLSFTCIFAPISLLKPPNDIDTPASPPKPPDPSFQKADSTLPPPPPKPPDRSFLRMPVESQVTGEPILPPPPPKPPDRKWVQLSHHKTKSTPSDSTLVIDQSGDPSGPISRNRSTPLDFHYQDQRPPELSDPSQMPMCDQ